MASFIFNLIKNIGKPVLNTINSIVQSLDSDGSERQNLALRFGLRTLPALKSGVSLDHYTRALDSGTPQYASAEEEEAANALYAMQKVREFNVLQNEIPLLGYDDYEFDVAQAYQIKVPVNMSVIQTHFCSPIMNLGAKFLSLAQKFRVFKVERITLKVNFQNQMYSTQTIAYDSIVTKENRKEMQNDIEDLMQGHDPSEAATGHMAEFYVAQEGQVPAPLPDGTMPGVFGQYLASLARIQSLPYSKTYDQVSPGDFDAEQPSFMLVGMRPAVASNPVLNTGMQFVSFDYASDFFKTYAQDGQAINLEQMPVYGKFHYAFSNTYNRDVDVITTLQYHLVCKRNVDNSTYTHIVNGDGDGDEAGEPEREVVEPMVTRHLS